MIEKIFDCGGMSHHMKTQRNSRFALSHAFFEHKAKLMSTHSCTHGRAKKTLDIAGVVLVAGGANRDRVCGSG